MKSKTRGYAGNQTGAVVPLVAIMLVLFMGCLALVVDLGLMHNVKVQLQRSADAAALGGALQLNTGLDEGNRAESAARAAAAANRVHGTTGFINDGGWASQDDTTVRVELGQWDRDQNKDKETRFTSAANPYNAVRVTTTFEVPLIFGRILPIDNPTVKARAIAVTDFEEQSIPVAVSSCMPSDTSGEYTLPGQNMGDLELLVFGSKEEDNAAWTSLVFDPASNQTIERFFDEACGMHLFNNAVYGQGGSGGLEYTPVKKVGGCTISDNSNNIGQGDDLCAYQTTINCGLGGEFSSPPLQADPLAYNPLPRWTDKDDFFDIYTMKGVLAPYPDEEPDPFAAGSSFRNRLADLKKASDPENDYTIADYNNDYSDKQVSTDIPDDGRFVEYIDKDNLPIYVVPLLEAGYPEVTLIEGVTATIKALLRLLVPTNDQGQLVGNQFKQTLSSEYWPFDEEGHDGGSGGRGSAVRFVVPVIFTGLCDNADYNKPLPYIGTGSLLVTRIWDSPPTQHCYDHGDDAITVSNWFHRFGSNKRNYDLPALVGDQLRCSHGFETSSIEALFKPPADGKEEVAGILRVYLVQ